MEPPALDRSALLAQTSLRGGEFCDAYTDLIDAWPVKGPFDMIFCRNVFIYFDARTKASILDRFVALLAPGGFLYLGHSESLPQPHPKLRLIGRTIYERTA